MAKNSESTSDRLENFLDFIERNLSALKICQKEAAILDDGSGVALTLQDVIVRIEKECRNVQNFLNSKTQTEDDFMETLPHEIRFGQLVPFK
ncbi:MAG: hypothetical protein C4518_08655 [Desulfobacteraceae bacterium]|nr:MAG: hypothetical protein C4518_08655 [Desulfobacteraceae bacterium]